MSYTEEQSKKIFQDICDKFGITPDELRKISKDDTNIYVKALCRCTKNGRTLWEKRHNKCSDCNGKIS